MGATYISSGKSHDDLVPYTQTSKTPEFSYYFHPYLSYDTVAWVLLYHVHADSFSLFG